MNEVREFIGIDISKLTFDVFSSDLGAMKFNNDEDGFKQFLEVVDVVYSG